ncbi:hypothetical protein M885DRAFT_592388 [Pelagophyceae sp. CCMP2097]|nr:hypothetical protein M885DRAFT_592388 [Pelagophyceae sp. CCMP2097]
MVICHPAQEHEQYPRKKLASFFQKAGLETANLLFNTCRMEQRAQISWFQGEAATVDLALAKLATSLREYQADGDQIDTIIYSPYVDFFEDIDLLGGVLAGRLATIPNSPAKRARPAAALAASDDDADADADPLRLTAQPMQMDPAPPAVTAQLQVLQKDFLLLRSDVSKSAAKIYALTSELLVCNEEAAALRAVVDGVMLKVNEVVADVAGISDRLPVDVPAHGAFINVIAFLPGEKDQLKARGATDDQLAATEAKRVGMLFRASRTVGGDSIFNSATDIASTVHAYRTDLKGRSGDKTDRDKKPDSGLIFTFPNQHAYEA